MSRELYFVDWSDQPFPQIRHAKYATEYDDLVSFGEAKSEIIESHKRNRDFYRDQIKYFRSMKKSEVEDCDW